MLYVIEYIQIKVVLVSLTVWNILGRLFYVALLGDVIPKR